jgi:hypothetical protein
MLNANAITTLTSPNVSTVQPAECTYRIRNAATGLYMNIAGGVMKIETNVQVYNNPSSLDSQWLLKHVNGTDYSTFAAWKDTGMVLNLAGGGEFSTNVQLYNNANSTDSQWQITTADNVTYWIQAANNNMYVCSEGNLIESNVKVCENSSEPTAQWMLETVSCEDDSLALNGIMPYEPATQNCTWNLKHVMSGLFLNVAGGATANEANVQLYGNPNSTDSQWVLAGAMNSAGAIVPGRTNLLTKNNVGFALNLAGGGSFDLANAQIYNNPTSSDSQFIIYQIGGDSTNATDAGGNSTNATVAGGNSTNATVDGGNSTNVTDAGGNSTNATVDGRRLPEDGNSTNATDSLGNSTNATDAGGNSTNATNADGNSTTYFLIKSVNGPEFSGMFLGANGAANETNVQLFADASTPYVQWVLQPLGDCA